MKKRLLTTCVLMAIYGQSPLAIAAAPMLQETDFNDDYLEEDFGDDQFGDFYGSDEFISIATGTQKSISKAPSVATVITSEQINKLGVNTVHQAIETVTGIHVYPSNLNRMNPSYSIRGIHTSQNPQVLVMVNGERTTQNWSGAKWDLFNVGIELVDRIEVIRGPGSAVHGADAFSGVINIITKGAEESFSEDMGIKAGSFGYRTVWINKNAEFDELLLTFNAQWEEYAGDDSRVIQQDALHGLGLGAISNAPGPLNTELDSLDLRLGFNYQSLYGHIWYLENEGETGAGAAQVLSLDDNADNSALTFKLGYKTTIDHKLNIEAWLNYQRVKEDTYFTIFPAGMGLPNFDSEGNISGVTIFTDGIIGAPALDDKNLSAEITAVYTEIKNHNLRFSLGYSHNDMEVQEFKNFGPLAQDFVSETRDGTLTNVTGTPYIFAPNVDREVIYVSIQDEWSIAKDWELTAGIRYDDYSDFGSTVNPRAALVWQAAHNLTAKAIYGKAFRAPSFSELYAINNPVILGNPSLDPEKIDTFEIALDYRPNFDWKLLFNIFSYSAQNLIIYTPQNDGSNLANNAAEQDGFGGEFEAHWKSTENLSLKFGVSWQSAEDGTSEQDIPDAPGLSYDLALDWNISEDFHLHMDSRWIANRKRLLSDTRDEIDNYNWTNVHLMYDLNTQTQLSASVRNLFNENAYEPSDGQIPGDFPLEERGYWLKLRYQL